MKINPNGFREYDARWLFEKDIDIDGINDLGKGLGSQVIKHTKKTNPRIIVGHDYRSYSEKIKQALIKGLISTGCYIEDVGLSLSPMVYYAQFNLKSDAIATSQLFSINFRPFAYFFLFKKNVVPGNKVAITFEEDSASIPSLSIAIKWSAEAAPISTANLEAPKYLNSSACNLGIKPYDWAVSKIFLLCLMSK